ncbi:uncharacterized protein LOC116303529 isoform X2 [Actinia tenebrosa]|uniref:Uncharacterized protein LOC116303529 isoform X2 n=1 Tax=Actinia tenebrosa TaxID=6105 RepID=A0A6P8IPI0_ACTTE|nr:uncharacterized protein LOC116303529 isoform X2 [Actinia tenebrosa]
MGQTPFKRKAICLLEESSSDDDDDYGNDEGEVPFVGEDLASLNLEKIQRENQYLKEELFKLKQTMKAPKLKHKELPKVTSIADGSDTASNKTETANIGPAGVPSEYADSDIARKLNLVPLVPGTNVFLSPSKLATAGNGVSSPTILTYNLLRVFFKKETISISNYNGGGTAGHTALDRAITSAIIGYVKVKMPQTKTSSITAAMNSYCTRIRNQLKVKENKNE